jgi:hypothetical protein
MSTTVEPSGEATPGAGPAVDAEARLTQLFKDFRDLAVEAVNAMSGHTGNEDQGPGPTVGERLRALSGRVLADGGYKSVAAFTIIFLVMLAATVLFYFYGPPSGSFDKSKLNLPTSSATCPKAKVTVAAQVSPASGATAIMNIYIGRQGNREQGGTAPLAIQKGSLCAGSILPMTAGTFMRSDGATLQANQVLSWAQVGGTGNDLTVQVVVAPHHGPPPGAGAYSGSVYLDNSAAQGAKVPVRVHIEYQNIKLVWAFSALAAFAGFIWAWLLHTVAGGKSQQGYFLRSFALCAAVILAAAIPILNVQVLSKPDWQGSATQYIGLATLVGAAAIAATPTLRALVLPPGLGKDKGRPQQAGQGKRR